VIREGQLQSKPIEAMKKLSDLSACLNITISLATLKDELSLELVSNGLSKVYTGTWIDRTY